MRIIPISRYNAEFLGRVDKSRIYFNPDNSVVILDESEQDVFDWVAERGAKLKESRFFLNEASAEKIRGYIAENNSPEIEAPKNVVESIEDAVAFESIPELKTPEENDMKRAKAKKAILKELDNKLTVMQLTQVVKKLAALV